MQPQTPDVPRTLPGERIALLVLVVGLFASLLFLVHGWYDPTNDGSMYIVTARSIGAGEGYSMLGIPFQIRPPGFAYLIAPLIALRGTDFYALNLFVSVFGAVGVLLLYFCVRERLGWPLAWLLAVAVWTNPGYQELCNQPMSDVPGTTLLLGCLLLARWSGRKATVLADLILGLAIGLSAYVRSVDILLVPAILVARTCTRMFGHVGSDGWRPWLARLGALALGAFLVQLPWSLRNSALDTPPPADQTLLYSYSAGMWHTDPGDPASPRLPGAEVLGRFPRQMAKVAAVLGNRLTATKRGTAQNVVCVFLLASSLYVLLKRRGPPEFFVAGTLVIVAFYFGFAARLLLPVYLLVLPSAVELVRDVGRRLHARWGGLALAGAGLVGLIVLDFSPRNGWDEVERRHGFYTGLCAGYEAGLEADARLAAQRGWHYSVFMDRPVYSLEFAIKRAGLPRAGETIIDKYDLNTVIASPLVQQERELLVPYLQRRYGQRPGRALVYRVRE